MASPNGNSTFHHSHVNNIYEAEGILVKNYTDLIITNDIQWNDPDSIIIFSGINNEIKSASAVLVPPKIMERLKKVSGE